MQMGAPLKYPLRIDDCPLRAVTRHAPVRPVKEVRLPYAEGPLVAQARPASLLMTSRPSPLAVTRCASLRSPPRLLNQARRGASVGYKRRTRKRDAALASFPRTFPCIQYFHSYQVFDHHHVRRWQTILH